MASINNMYPKKYYYDLGEFVAKTMLDGIIHPDLQLSNIGCNDEIGRAHV